MLVSIHYPAGSELLVKHGQTVEYGQPFYREKKSSEIRIELSKALGVPPDKIFQHLKKFVGDEVKRSELLAERRGMMGSRQFHSEFDGVIKEINHNEGVVVLSAVSEEEGTVKSFFSGEVVETAKDHVKIKLKGAKAYDLKQAVETAGFGAGVYYHHAGQQFTEEEVLRKVVVSDDMTEYETVKMEALEAFGLVTLKEIGHPAELPHVQVKNMEDWKKIHEEKKPYCLAETKENKIYFYE